MKSENTSIKHKYKRYLMTTDPMDSLGVIFIYVHLQFKQFFYPNIGFIEQRKLYQEKLFRIFQVISFLIGIK